MCGRDLRHSPICPKREQHIPRLSRLCQPDLPRCRRLLHGGVDGASGHIRHNGSLGTVLLINKPIVAVPRPPLGQLHRQRVLLFYSCANRQGLGMGGVVQDALDGQAQFGRGHGQRREHVRFQFGQTQAEFGRFFGCGDTDQHVRQLATLLDFG